MSRITRVCTIICITTVCTILIIAPPLHASHTIIIAPPLHASHTIRIAPPLYTLNHYCMHRTITVCSSMLIRIA
jgi:hypothetical protein